MYIISLSVSIILTAIVGIVAGCFIQNRVTAKRLGDAKDLATRIINEARKEASAQKKELLVQCQDEILQQKKAMEIEYREQEREIKNRKRTGSQRTAAGRKRSGTAKSHGRAGTQTPRSLRTDR